MSAVSDLANFEHATLAIALWLLAVVSLALCLRSSVSGDETTKPSFKVGGVGFNLEGSGQMSFLILTVVLTIIGFLFYPF